MKKLLFLAAITALCFSSTANAQTWTVYYGVPNYNTRAAVVDDNLNAWVATFGGGVSKVKNGSYVNYNSGNSGLTDNNVNCIALDAAGNKWIGTFSSGVFMFNGTTWTRFYTGNSAIPGNKINSIAIDANNVKWFGVDGFGLVKYDGTTFTTYSLPNNTITCITIDAANNKWVGSYGGLFKFNGTTTTSYTSANAGLAHDQVYAVAIENPTTLWVGTYMGLCKFNGTTTVQTYTTTDGLPNNVVGCVAVDLDGNKWVGTMGTGAYGMAMFDGVSSWTPYNLDNHPFDMPGNDIRCITVDRFNNKWICSNDGGLAFYGTEVTLINPINTRTCFGAGTGADGAFSATADMSITGGEHHYTSFNINSGVTVNVTDTVPLRIYCTGAVTIDGALKANGGNGGDGVTNVSAGLGGIGVAGGKNGGDGSFTVTLGGVNGNPGMGPGGINTQGVNFSGGGGAGFALVGGSSIIGVGGVGGPQYGNVYLSELIAGSGGGAGSGGNNCGSGAGGAGGGLIVINSAVSINISATGQISCNGGTGGTDGGGYCGGGGGGSGGAIWLAAPSMTLNGLLSAVGGTGGTGDDAGATGSPGRIRLDYNNTLNGAGSSNPVAGSHFAIPAVEFSVSVTSTPACFNSDNGTATVTPLGGLSPYTYLWSPSGGFSAIESGLVAGNYTCLVIDTAYCWKSTAAVVAENPAIDVTISTNLGTFTANTASASYQWLDCNNSYVALPSETGQSYSPVIDGSYAVEITVGDCVDTSACNIFSTVGTADIDQTTLLQVSPNPGTGVYNFELPAAAEVRVGNIAGQQLLELSLEAGTHSVDLSDQPAGIYWIMFTGEHLHQVIRLIKE